MDTFLIISGSILMLAGIIGCILPVLPGPPLSYLGLLILQFTSMEPFSVSFLINYAIVTIIVVALDYLSPVLGAKFGGSRYGTIGSIIGLLGVFIHPIAGLILGPFFGAVLGELIGGKDFGPALKAGFGVFLGLLAGTLLKLFVSLLMAWHFIAAFF